MNPTDEVNDVQVKPAPKRRGCLGCLGRGAIGLVAILAIAIVAGAIYQSASSASDSKNYPPPGQLYDVGDNKLHLYCTGEGSPTVILEAGAGSPSLAWFLVQEKVAEFTRVCSYDRAGFGWSEPASGLLSTHQVAANLHGLLEAAGVPGPYVLVGHSAGGVLTSVRMPANTPPRCWGWCWWILRMKARTCAFLPDSRIIANAKIS